MSEFWVSKNKFYCKYCNVYIADDKPSRQHHETGMRHKGNLERYIYKLYQKGSQKEKDRAEELRAMNGIEAAAAAAMGLPVPGSTSRTTSGSPAPAPKASAASSDPYANYSTAQSLGFIDEEAEKAKAQKELREKEGRVGEWSVVTNSKGTREEEEVEESGSAEQKALRALEDPDRKTISFSYLKEKSLPADDDDGYDQIAIKVREPKTAKGRQNPLSKAMDQARTQAPAGTFKAVAKANGDLSKLKFKPVEAKYEDEDESEEQVQARQQSAWDLIAPSEDQKPVVEVTDAGATSMPLFKKRKTERTSTTSLAAKRRA